VELVFGRLLNRLRLEGPGATARAVVLRLRKLAYVREEHVWYGRDLTVRGAHRELPEGLRLVRADATEVGTVARLGQNPDEASARVAAGNDIWLVLEGDDPLFLCFTFRHATPVIAAVEGSLSLPPGTACLEDSVTAPEARGRGIASAAWTLIGEELRRDGFRKLVVKIETSNVASERVAEKSGFRPVAVMHHQRTGVRRHTAVLALGGGLGDELAARLP
jgi:GNAT superfamily N-acetyltransferase